MNDWQKGQTVGRYRLTDLIGRGGVGEVWRAEDRELHRIVCLKKLLGYDAHSGKSAASRFARESRVMARLSHHANIVVVYDVAWDADAPYIIMEFVDGFDLAALARRGVISLGRGLTIAIQVSEALAFAHSFGILHRDIKPGNILIDRNTGESKLTDFGLAREPLEDYATITMTGAFFGTPRYASPEQLRDIREADQSSDIYSLGVSLYQLFSGRLPFERASLGDLIKSKESPPPALASLRSDVEPKFSDLIRAMLKFEPEARPKDLGQVIPVLRELLDRTPVINWEHEPARPDLTQSPESEERGYATVVTIAANDSVPTGFAACGFGRSEFFGEADERFSKVRESLEFYRNHLTKEYESLLSQANHTYRLWMGCVIAGFTILLAGVVAMLSGAVTEGIATAASTIIVYFIQRVFQQREDHYRSLSKTKHQHLEYGNQWLLVIQSIDAMIDPNERSRKQAKLVDVLTKKLSGVSLVQT